MKSRLLIPVLPSTVTVIFPVVAFSGTLAVIKVSETDSTVPAIPLNVTEVLAINESKFLPEIETTLLNDPFSGVKPAITGAGFESGSFLHDDNNKANKNK